MKICPLCAVVSLLWFSLSVGMVLGFLPTSKFQLPTSILMGGTVVGIAYQRDSLRWKIGTVLLGMLLAYIFVTNISIATVVIEFIILFFLTLFFFGRKTPADIEKVRSLEEKMKSCC